MLMILDGWGIPANPEVSAINKAQTPFVDSLYNKYPTTRLFASGLSVGLPDGQMGNSEVGHMNLGAGRVVYQDLVKINKAIEEGSFFKEEVLLSAMRKLKESGKALHIFGLLSDGGVHSHILHAKALASLAHKEGLKNVYFHVFTDGRDCDPKSGLGFVQDLQTHLESTTGQLASIIGRYYAMDRDKRWERVQKAYDLLVKGEGKVYSDAATAIRESYAEGVTDEFILPISIQPEGEKLPSIQSGDTAICFNFRTDRGREITQVLTQEDFPDQGMKKLDLDYITMTRYDDSFKGVDVVFDKDNLTETLGEVLAKAGKTQVRIAETEKYPHVTFFFSGGREEPFEGERRLLCASPKVATYDLQPEMSAFDIRDKIVADMDANPADFICLNFANPDMVGHTGVMEAAIKACETVDSCAESVVKKALEKDYRIIILADHGNADCLINPDGSPNTAHTTQPVPCFVLSPEATAYKLHEGVLGDIAPSLLHLMELNQPEVMSGKSIIEA
jgi:2,3-bisphosphoglycerate-independent phosphoglycerate mutase